MVNGSKTVSSGRAMCVTLCLALLLAVCGRSALADGITATIGPQGDGPATVLYCGAGSYGQSGVLFFQEDFENTMTEPLAAVKIRFDLYDAFGTYLAGISADRTGTFSENARIANSGYDADSNPLGWRIRDYWPDASRMVCSIEKTLDADGTVWTNATLPIPPPSPAPESHG
jgi:hypothetical protein